MINKFVITIVIGNTLNSIDSEVVTSDIVMFAFFSFNKGLMVGIITDCFVYVIDSSAGHQYKYVF